MAGGDSQPAAAAAAAVAASLKRGATGRDRSRSPPPESLSRAGKLGGEECWCGAALSYVHVSSREWSVKPQPTRCCFQSAATGAANEERTFFAQLHWNAQEGVERRGPPRFVLFADGDIPPKVAFSLDLHPRKGAPSFLDPEFDHHAATNRIEGLDLVVSVSDKVAHFASTVVDAAVVESVERDAAASWFKRGEGAGGGGGGSAAYIPWLRSATTGEDGTSRYPPRLRVILNLAGPSWALTRLSITHPNCETVRGQGWPFLREHMGASRLRNAAVCLTVELSGVWCRGGTQFGLRVRATEAIFFTQLAHEDEECQRLDAFVKKVVAENATKASES